MDVQAVSALLAALLILAIGASVLLRSRTDRMYTAFAAFAFTVSAWHLCTFIAATTEQPGDAVAVAVGRRDDPADRDPVLPDLPRPAVDRRPQARPARHARVDAARVCRARLLGDRPADPRHELLPRPVRGLRVRRPLPVRVGPLRAVPRDDQAGRAHARRLPRARRVRRDDADPDRRAAAVRGRVARGRQRPRHPLPVLPVADAVPLPPARPQRALGKMAVLGTLVVLLSAVYGFLLYWVGERPEGPVSPQRARRRRS